MATRNVGQHLIVELWDCQHLDSPEIIRKALEEAVEACQGTLLDMKIHSFSPQGVTGFALIAESHISVHTWPELGYAAVDVFTCGDRIDPEAAIKSFKKYFQPAHIQLMQIIRGVLRE